MQNRESRWQIVEQTIDLLLIQDIGPWDQYLTITNDAESVVTQLADLLDDRRLGYIDSEGQRSQLNVVNGQFAGFAPLVYGEGT